MKTIMKKYTSLLILILLNVNIYSQVSITDLKKLSNTQLDMIKTELQESSSLPNPEDVQQAIDIDSPKSSNIKKSSIIKPDLKNPFFGYDYFNVDKSIFDNMPLPRNYTLGPGDKIIISLWGEVNKREEFVLNKEGQFFYPNIGFINISNKTIDEAEKILNQSFAIIYSTLLDKNSSTSLRLELAELKSINVYFTGQFKNPGINIIHPFSDIFLAIIQAGGVADIGSLRNVQLIRNDKMISTFDFYDFFVKGTNNFLDVRILDGDSIHIPTVNKRVEINGDIHTKGFFELQDDEVLADLVEYAGGFKATASSTSILNELIPLSDRSSDDNARSSRAVFTKNFDKIYPNNGDSIFINSIFDKDLSVTVFGRIKSPGDYPSNGTLKEILDLAGGFDDPVFRKSIRDESITVLRRDSKQFYSNEIEVAYKDADQFELEPNDKIFVYEDINYKNNFTYRVEGEVFKPGTYAIRGSAITVGEALSIAGGLTHLSSVRNLTVKQEFTTVSEAGNEIISSEVVNNITLDFELGINSVLIASPFENVVRVEGNVYNPGLITFTKGYRYPRYIELAGGYKPNTLKNKTYIKRANGNIEKVNGYFISRGKNVYPGDTIVVHENTEPQDFDITAFISDLSTTLANIAAILLIVENQKD